MDFVSQDELRKLRTMLETMFATVAKPDVAVVTQIATIFPVYMIVGMTDRARFEMVAASADGTFMAAEIKVGPSIEMRICDGSFHEAEQPFTETLTTVREHFIDDQRAA